MKRIYSLYAVGIALVLASGILLQSHEPYMRQGAKQSANSAATFMSLVRVARVPTT
jgi:hypothetical protein